MRSARNAFLVLLVVLVGISTYQFYSFGSITAPVAVMWVVGAGTFYASKWYYGRSDGADGTGESGAA
jgi:hypothetical protein